MKGKVLTVKRVLPFTLDVPLKAFSHYSVYLAILKMHDINITTLLLNHFITFHFCHLDGFISYLEERRLRSLFSRNRFPSDIEDPKRFLKKAIDEELYLFVDLDYAHISTLPFRFHYVHEFLVYGYDDESEVFFASGHILDKKQGMYKLEEITISYSDLILSYQSACKYKKGKHLNYTIRMKKRSIKDRLNVNKIRRDLFLYSYSILPYIFVYSFNRLSHKMHRRYFIKRTKDGKGFINPVFLKVIQERTTLFKMLVEKLSIKNELADECFNLYNSATIALMLAAKYNVKYGASNTNAAERTETLMKIYGLLECVEKKEFEIVKGLYKVLRKRRKKG